MSVRIYPRNAALNREAGEIRDWQSLDIEKFWAGTGNWKLTLPLDHPRAVSLIAIGAGVYVQLDGSFLFSGPVRSRKKELSAKGWHLTVAGPDDSWHLAKRRAAPCPAVWGATIYSLANGVAQAVSYPTVPNDVQNGVAETVIKHYVDAHVGPSAETSRQVPLLSIAADRARGAVVSTQTRFDPEGEVLAALAVQGGDLGYGIAQVGAGLVFDIDLPTDRTASMRFSPKRGTLTKCVIEESEPTANDLLVAAQGEGTERTFINARNQASIEKWGLIEGELIDRRDTEDVDTLLAALDEGLTKGQERLSLALTASETEARRYRRDWDIGTYGTVEVQGSTYTELIRSVKLSWKNGEAMTAQPFIGTPDAPHPEVLDMFAKERALTARTGRLERAT